MLQRLGASEPTVVAVAGEPGIGKSSMLADLMERAEGAGLLTLSGRAAQFERDAPFAIFIDALDDYLATQAPRRLSSLGRGRIGELARIFPSLAELGDTELGAGQAERYRAHYAVRALLDLLAEPRPMVLSLDDVQWADDASLELVSHLLRRPGSASGLVVLAYRSGEMPGRLEQAVDIAERECRLEMIELGPLSEADAARLLPGSVDAETRRLLHSDSGGNPFYLEQLWRARGEAPAPAFGAPEGFGGDVPPSVAAALAGEVAACGAAARALLQGGSVAGDPFTFELAVAAADLSDAEAREALDELLTHELVRPTEVPRRFSFRHPVVHRAVYGAAQEGWRLGAHARVRDLLVAQGATATELAHHVERAAAAGDEQAIAVLKRAAQEAARLGPGPSARWFAAALRLLPKADVVRRLELLVPMATALAAAGRLDESRDVVLEALGLLPGDAEEERVALVSALAGIDLLLGRDDEARDLLRATLAALPDPSSPGVVALQIELAVEAFQASEWDRALAAAEQALKAARALDRPPLLVVAGGLRSLSLAGLGRTADAEQSLAAAAGLLDSLSDSQLAERVDAPYYVGFAESFLERYADGVDHLRRGVEIARSIGEGRFLAQMNIGAAWCLIHLGQAAEAAELAEDAVEAAQLFRNEQALSWALGMRSWVARVAGDVDEAVRAGEESVAIGAARDQSVISAAMRAHLALAYIEAGEPERCIEELTAAGAPEFAIFTDVQKPFWCEALCRASLALGRLDEAEAWAARGEGFASGLSLPVAGAVAKRARARVLRAREQPEQAAAAALEAAAAHERRGVRIEAARSRIIAGQALAAAARRDEAVAELERAYAALDACGVDRYRDEAARELRRLGRRMPRGGTRAPGMSGVASLSAREREIAELVAQARTNREIAATLYISEKTVEKHLTKVFAKLGVAGRAAIGGQLAAAGEGEHA